MPPPSSSVGAARPPRHASISPRRRRALTRLALLILLACVVWSERPGGALRASRDHVRLLERFAESSDADAVAARDAFASLRDVGDPLPPTCAAEIAAARGSRGPAHSDRTTDPLSHDGRVSSMDITAY